jgi:hypothetical protein
MSCLQITNIMRVKLKQRATDYLQNSAIYQVILPTFK